MFDIGLAEVGSSLAELEVAGQSDVKPLEFAVVVGCCTQAGPA